MSAAAVAPEPLSVRTQRRLSELEATRRISRTGAFAVQLREGLEDIIRVAMRTQGVAGLEIQPAEPLQALLRKPLRYGVVCSGATGVPGASEPIPAPIVTEGKTWGTLRLHSETTGCSREGLPKFCVFLGQQIGLLLVRFEASAHRDVLARKASLFRRLVERRKAIHRAKALLVHAHRITEDEAFLLLRRHSRDSGSSLHQVAEAVISSDHQRWRQAASTPMRRRRAAAPAHRRASSLQKN